MKLTPLILSRYNVNGRPLKNGRKLTRVPFPFNGCLPLSLRNHVAGTGESSKGVPCIFEMNALLACLKENEFNERKCLQESDVLIKCNEASITEFAKQKVQEKEGILVPGAKEYSAKQLNKLLSQYPQPNIKR